jgi:hypothetical protein
MCGYTYARKDGGTMAYLLIVGVIIQVIMLVWIVVLHKRINTLQQMKKDNEKIQQETEDLLMSFILEMKEENEAFLKRVKNVSITEYKAEKREILAKQESSIDMKEEDIAYKEFLPPFSEEGVPTIEEEIELIEQENESVENIAKEANRLLQEGIAVEEIAKKLNKGKTEIELLVKFRQSRKK